MAENPLSSTASSACCECDGRLMADLYSLMKRKNPYKHKDKVYIGCGAGFGGDRPMAALKLLKKVDLDYIVLECLAERTLADRYNEMEADGEGYDPRLEEWMRLLLPLAVQKRTCIITNMGAVNTTGAQKKTLEIASSMGISINVGAVHHSFTSNSAVELLEKDGINESVRTIYSQVHFANNLYSNRSANFGKLHRRLRIIIYSFQGWVVEVLVVMRD